MRVIAYDEIEDGHYCCGPANDSEFKRHLGVLTENHPTLVFKPFTEVLASGEPFIYPIFWRYYVGYPRGGSESFLVRKGLMWLKDHPILPHLRSGNAILVLYDWFEGERFDENFNYHYHDKFTDLIAMLDVPPKSIAYVNGNAKLPSEETPETPKYIYDNFWLTFFNKTTPEAEALIHPKKKPFKYLSYARHWNSIRQYFTFELYFRNLLKDGLVSLGVCHAFAFADTKIIGEQHDEFMRRFHEFVPEATSADAEAFLKSLPLELDADLTINHAGSLNYQHHLDTEISVIHETDAHISLVQNRSLFISEKTIRALFLGHPFIMVGPPGTLKELRRMGYQTFHPYIDESYDDEPNPMLRKNKVMEQLVNYITRPDREEIYQKIQQRANYNRLYYKSPKRQTFGQNLIKELNLCTTAS